MSTSTAATPTDPPDPLTLSSASVRAAFLRSYLPALRARDERERRDELAGPHGLSELQVFRMLARYALRELDRSPLTKRVRGEDWREWSEFVLRISVDLRPGGRAVLRGPDARYRVEMRFARTGYGKEVAPTAIQVIGDRFLGTIAPDLAAYHAALVLRVGAIDPNARKGFFNAPPIGPEPGKPPKTEFFRQLLATYNQLVAEGARNPVGILAEQMDKPKGTVKSWLSRGRKYLSTEKGD